MQFYRFEGFAVNEKQPEDEPRRIVRERNRGISLKSEDFNRNLKGKAYFCIYSICEDIVSACILCSDSIPVDTQISAYLNAMQIEVKDTVLEEITFESASDFLRRASREGFILDDDRVMEKFGLDRLCNRFHGRLEYSERITNEIQKSEAYSLAEDYAMTESLIPELDRIYSVTKKTKAFGHPVHYFIETDDVSTRETVINTLLGALYANGRIKSRRYVFMNITPDESLNNSIYDCLYKSCVGGTVVVRLFSFDGSENDCASGERENIEKICEYMKKYRNQVLTVFCLPSECTRTRSMILENLVNSCIVEIKEDVLSEKKAENYLKSLAKKNGVRADKKLLAMTQVGKSYSAHELRSMYDCWFNNKLINSVYPQYSQLFTVEKEIRTAKHKGTAIDELNEMIGLTEAKKVITRALDYYKAQKLFADKGMKNEKPSMHMVFTGNPGTAKTTVARLFAEIMKENGLLSRGHITEVGRGDLVGKYVGWTAPTIQRKFREAMGGVLFIDEAYSLVDDRDGSYGDEAINTIVQEMENHREDVVVIFAGYPDKMENFLEKNPGLRSRIAFHVPFEDYDTPQLVSIAKLITKKKGLYLNDDACEKLVSVFDMARTRKDFGNGRFVRNIIEKARMAQAGRLLEMDYESVGTKDITTICAEDIENSENERKQPSKTIGFCA